MKAFILLMVLLCVACSQGERNNPFDASGSAWTNPPLESMHDSSMVYEFYSLKKVSFLDSWNDPFDTDSTMLSSRMIQQNSEIIISNYKESLIGARPGGLYKVYGYETKEHNAAPFAITESESYIIISEMYIGGVDKITLLDKTMNTIVREFGETTGNVGTLSFISDLAYKDGLIYACQPQDGLIRVFDTLGTEVNTLRPGNDVLFTPFALHFAANGVLYIVQENSATLFKYQNALFQSITVPVKGKSGFSFGAGITSDPQGNIYVASPGLKCVVVFDVALNVIGTIGSEGFADGMFQNPFDLLYHDGVLYVWDSKLRTIQGFTIALE
ncbi:MAG: hypothetical protein OCD76_09055 [Reichenbachiella sp.]